MPLYEYRCLSCGEFERWLRLADLEQPVHCTTCDQAAQKLISAPNISLNSGRLPRDWQEAPKVLTRKQIEPTQARYQQAPAGRPWMVSHTPSRY